jgi:hypothetical protein
MAGLSRIIRIESELKPTIVFKVFFEINIENKIEIDCQLSIIKRGMGRKQKLLKTDLILKDLTYYLQYAYDLKTPPNSQIIISNEKEITFLYLHNRVINFIEKTKLLSTIFVYYEIKNNQTHTIIINEDSTFIRDLPVKQRSLTTTEISQIMGCLIYLHKQTNNNDYLNIDTVTLKSSINRKAKEIQALSKEELKLRARKIIESVELTLNESSEFYTAFSKEKDLSLIVSVYDSINRFILGNPHTEAKKNSIKELNYIVESKGNLLNYKATITAANVETLIVNGGKIKNTVAFPGASEAVVELGLRKLLELKGGVVSNGSLGILFYINELKMVLKNHFNATYSADNIKQSLEILHKTNISIEHISQTQPPLDFTMASSSYLPILKWGANNEKIFVSLHVSIMNEITSLDFRAINTQSLKLNQKSFTQATQISKQLYILWSYATYNKPYKIKMSRLLGNSGILSNNGETNKRNTMRALDSLKNNETIIENWSWEAVKSGKKIIDRNITMYPTEFFIKQQKKISALKNIKLLEVAEMVEAEQAAEEYRTLLDDLDLNIEEANIIDI